MRDLAGPSVIFKRFFPLLLAALWLTSLGSRSAFGQTSCETCSEDRYNCEVNAEWTYQSCRQNGGDESSCENGRQTTLQGCENTYNSCSATCDPGGFNPSPSPQSGCTDNGYGALTSLESNGYLSGWAADADGAVMMLFYVDRTVDPNNTNTDIGGYAMLRLPPGSGYGFSFVLPSRYRDGQVHTLYGYTSDPCYGIRPLWQGTPQSFLLTPGNPIDDPHTFVRQLFIDDYRREPDQSGWDSWTSFITACGGDANCVSSKKGAAAAAFLDTNEYAGYGAVPELTWTPKGTNDYNQLFVKALYRSLLRRDAEDISQAEIDAWVSVLNGYGSPTPQAAYDAVAASFVASAEYRNRFY
jgi:hypothetical protein